jgi:hypothetical protein
MSLDLEAIKKREAAATPGKWQTRFVARAFASARKDPELLVVTPQSYDWLDADFIAHARTDVPALILEVERLRDELKLAESNAAATVRDANQAINDLIRRPMGVVAESAQAFLDRKDQP